MDGQLAADGVEGMNSYSPPATPNSFSRPRPLPQRSPSQTAKIRVQNRRREYLERNPSYFTSAEQEFADPDLFDRLIRRFRSAAEREAEGRSKGWGKTLESSLMRGEARLERISSSVTGDTMPSSASSTSRKPNSITTNIDFSVADLVNDKPATKAEGRAAWDEFLRERFVRGGDEDFDYAKVDGDDDLDSLEHIDLEEAYFDDEEPEWADDSDVTGDNTDSAAEEGHKEGERHRRKRERILVGQTGIQDF
ncbi:unnamed protein product [Discula destructiva]